METILHFIEKFGRFCQASVKKAWILTHQAKSVSKYSNFLKNLVFLQFYKKQLLKAGFEFSFLSLSVIFLTALCTGAVLTLQTFAGLGFFASPNSVAKVVVPAIIRELGPVLTGLMIAGRISSSIAAQIATMKTTDQINALKTLSIDPIKYLVLPRVFVGTFLMPVLMIVANVVAFLGSFLIMVFKFNTVPSIFIEAITEFFVIKDLNVGLVKALFFGFIITVIGSFKGLKSTGNSEGVGVATTEAVVSASILILFCNYFLTLMFF
jgi:phospholipid/cholesterol/gamma-HCH transport system permease protein